MTRGRTGYASVFEVTAGYYVTGSHWYKTILTDGDATAGNETNMVWGYGTNGFTSNAIVRTNTDNGARCVRGNGTGEAAGEIRERAAQPLQRRRRRRERQLHGAHVAARALTSLLAWADAAAYCQGLTLDGGGFRVPTLNELARKVMQCGEGLAIVLSRDG